MLAARVQADAPRRPLCLPARLLCALCGVNRRRVRFQRLHDQKIKNAKCFYQDIPGPVPLTLTARARPAFLRLLSKGPSPCAAPSTLSLPLPRGQSRPRPARSTLRRKAGAKPVSGRGALWAIRNSYSPSGYHDAHDTPAQDVITISGDSMAKTTWVHQSGIRSWPINSSYCS